MSDQGARPGKVYLVGGGPGDPGLLTLRACQCLGRADLVLYDYLVNTRVLSHARAAAELICLGRHGRDRIMPQDEINRRMVEAARAGRTVVRLKGGDPAVFAHVAEEAHVLSAAGLEFEIVPGITAALAAASYAGIPITQSDLASAVAFVAGQEREDKPVSGLDYAALAAFPGTLVFYMGVTTARQWTGALIEAGKPAETPAVIVRRCSWPDQQRLACTLGSVADVLEAAGMRPPVVIVVGLVAALPRALDWFGRRPLFGQSILVTRPAEQAAGLQSELEELGARVLVQPAIEIRDPPSWQPADDALARLDSFDWLVFSSGNGVRRVLGRLLDSGRDLRALGKVRLAAIGPATAAELSRYHLKADQVPDQYRAEALADSLAGAAAGKRFLLIRASRGRELLAERLSAASGLVEQVVVYESRDVSRADAEIGQELAGGRIDWITVTSSAIARSLIRLFGSSLQKSKLVSISPVTSATLRELGHEPAAEAEQYTMMGIVEAISRYAHRPGVPK